MESLPVEVIGNILSRLGAARDVVIASATCRKWREACRKHLCILSFNSNDWPAYHELKTSHLEILITQTIFQTTSLQCLSIVMDEVDEFSAAPVIAWLMYTRETLRSLIYNVRTTPNINVLEKCGRQKLEMLALAHNTITGIEPSFQRFPCLRSLSLSFISVSALNLNLLLTACPKLETLVLISPEIAMSDVQATMELSSPTLKTIHIEAISSLEKFILEADILEVLHLKDSTLEQFELVGKGTLKHLEIDDVSFLHLDIGETEQLEVVDLSNFTILWPKFYQLISKSSKLRKLRLWGVVFDDEDEVVTLETIAVRFPKLRHLALSYELREGLFYSDLQGPSHLGHVAVLELGWTIINEHFGAYVAGILDRCPNVKRLIIHGAVSEIKTHEECQMLAKFTSSVLRLMKKHLLVDVQFEYE